MRRILATLLAGVMVLTGCAQSGTVLPDNSEISDETLREADDGLENTPSSKGENSEEAGTVALDGEEEIDFVSESEDGSKIEEFQSLNDPRLLQYVEDTVYTGLVDQYQSENYVIENVNAIYIYLKIIWRRLPIIQKRIYSSDIIWKIWISNSWGRPMFLLWGMMDKPR